jgi:PAS domain S-box-containing protein
MLSAWGVWELFRGGAHRFHLLSIFVAVFVSGLTVLIFQFFASRAALSEVRFARERLRLSMAVGHSAIWDLNVKTGQELWFGDLETLFGIPSDSLSAPGEDFYRYLHPADRQHVSQTVSEAREKRSPYTVEFRSIHSDGTVRWISAAGKFQYTKQGDPVRMLGITVDITDRKLAERALLTSEEKFSRAFRESPVALTLTSARDHRYLDVNQTFEEATGWRRDEVIGRTPFDINLWANPADREELAKAVLERKPLRNFEVRYHRRNGSEGVGLASADLIKVDGEPCILSAIVDITDRKRIEDSLRIKETELAEAQSLARLGSWQFDVESNSVSWSAELRRIHGLDPNVSEAIYKKVDQFFTPESWRRFRETIEHAIRTHEVPQVDLQLVRPDGSKRWISAQGRGVFDSEGRLVSIHGTSQDITERKLAEEAMASIGRRLIEAHEEERTRIGRELHDDINQRLALLGVELDRWNRKLPSSPQVRELVSHAQQRIIDIARDVQSLSHRLHSSKLDYLGLAMAANSFCSELSENGDVRVKFSHAGIPRTLPREVSLCLFRVLQEALQNAVKHSGVKDFTVDLRGTSEAIELTVTDTGFGFEEQEALTRQGLGLISMRERLQLVDGELSVESHRGAGTTIRARVPLNRDAFQAIAG